MTAKLLELEAVGGQRREIAVTKEEFLIGRGADCDWLYAYLEKRFKGRDLP